jgi:hypothetical protein
MDRAMRTRAVGSTLAVIALSLMGCTFVQEFQLNGDGGITAPGCGDSSDANNCGACGHSCLGGACTAGKCAPVVLASGQGDSASGVPWYPYTNDIGDPLVGPDRIAVDGTHAYWLNLRGEVMRVPIAGGTTERVAITKPGPAWIALDDQFVYFSTLGREIFRVSKGGGAPVPLVPAPTAKPAILLLPGDPYPTEFDVASGRLRWSDGNGVYACPVAGCTGAPEVIDSGTSESLPFSFAIDASGRMYVSEEEQSMTDPTTLTVEYAMTFFRDGQWLGLAGPTAYYEIHGGANEVYALATTDFGPTGVVRWAESSVTFLASGNALPGAARGLALDDGFVYWPNAAANQTDRNQRIATVVRCAKTGCAAPEVLAEGQIVPRAVAVSNEAVYFTTGDGNVMKLAKPGSGTPRSAR